MYYSKYSDYSPEKITKYPYYIEFCTKLLSIVQDEKTKEKMERNTL